MRGSRLGKLDFSRKAILETHHLLWRNPERKGDATASLLGPGCEELVDLGRVVGEDGDRRRAVDAAELRERLLRPGGDHLLGVREAGGLRETAPRVDHERKRPLAGLPGQAATI